MKARRCPDDSLNGTTLTEPDPKSPTEDPTMSHLAKQVADHTYNVNSADIAEEIIRKLRMIRWARQELLSAPGRNRQPGLRGP